MQSEMETHLQETLSQATLEQGDGLHCCHCAWPLQPALSADLQKKVNLTALTHVLLYPKFRHVSQPVSARSLSMVTQKAAPAPNTIMSRSREINKSCCGKVFPKWTPVLSSKLSWSSRKFRKDSNAGLEPIESLHRLPALLTSLQREHGPLVK